MEMKYYDETVSTSIAPDYVRTDDNRRSTRYGKLNAVQDITDTHIHSQLEEELSTKIYPGTEIMAGVGSHHFFKSGKHADRIDDVVCRY